MLSETALKKIKQSIIRTAHDVGDEIIHMAVRQVPVRTGTLKKSRFIEYQPNGVLLGFRAPYAARVNDGVEEGTREFIKRHFVKEHYRRSGAWVRGKQPTKRQRTLLGAGSRVKGWSSVKSHERGPFVRVLSFRAGNHFFDNAWDVGMKMLAPLLKQNLVWAQQERSWHGRR